MDDVYAPALQDEELLPYVLDREALSRDAGRSIGQDETCQRPLVRLLLAMKAKDSLLYEHSLRVLHFTHHLAQALPLPEAEVTTIELAALFHDVGKLAISDELLYKASGLTHLEREHIRRHPAYGALILSQARLLNKVAFLVYHHHERWDGSGYPSRLRGETIPFGSRMIAIADAFAAMTSHRVYQTTYTPAEGLEELCRCAGTQFDPVLVDRFCASLEADFPDKQRTEAGRGTGVSITQQLPPSALRHDSTRSILRT